MYADMSINSHYRGREMATTSSRVHPAGIAGRGDDEEDDSSCYSSEEDPMDAQDTSRLLREPGDPRSSRSHYETPLPNSSTGIYPQLQPLAPEPIIPAAGAVMAATTAPVTHNTQYGSVSDGSSLPSTGRNNPKKKRYRLPFLILLVFDFGLVVFLSIISYDSQEKDFDSIPSLSYFNLNLKNNYFDLVLLAILRLMLNSLLYLLMAWVTRAIMGLTTLVSAVYVPLKAYYCWPLTQSDDGSFQDIPILLILFISFVMPWAEAFFFEFKYLPAELSRLTSTSWRNWRFWLWPRALVRDESDDTPSLPDIAAPQRPTILQPHSRPYAASTISLDFRTPMGSTRNSPIPAHMVYGDRSGNPLDEDLPPITEEATPSTSPSHRTSPLVRLSEEDQRYKREGEEALAQLVEFTGSNDGWKHEKTTSSGIIFHSSTWKGKKIWKAEHEMKVTALQLWNILYPGESMPEWNPSCTKNETLHRVDEVTDVVYSVTRPVGPVSSRDFVSLRRVAIDNGCRYSASCATLYEPKPPQPGKVRGENGPCGYKVTPVADDKSLFVWVLNTDLKGWLPQSIIDQTLCSAMTGTYQKLNEFITRLREEGGL